MDMLTDEECATIAEAVSKDMGAIGGTLTESEGYYLRNFGFALIRAGAASRDDEELQRELGLANKRIADLLERPLTVSEKQMLEAHIAELEADAARYRWLRSGGAIHMAVFDCDEHGVIIGRLSDGNLDRAIDAARAATR